MPLTKTNSKVAASPVIEDEDLGIPPARDVRWASWSRPIWLWLGEDGRSWDEIKTWCQASGVGMSVLRHQIVWLEDKGLIEAVRLPSEKSSKGSWKWRRVRGTLESWKLKLGETRN